MNLPGIFLLNPKHQKAVETAESEFSQAQGDMSYRDHVLFCY